MAKRKNDVPQEYGVIRDENEDVRYDAGEAAKDKYEKADAYEKDRIELKGIVYFTLGLVIMIGVTFGLMRLLQLSMEEQAKAAYAKEKSPMGWTEDERKRMMNLPPEPRLQGAPGFEVQNPNGGNPISLELREPQAEYRELRKQWEDAWKNGRKDSKTGITSAMPMEDAKKKVLEGNIIKSRPAEQGQQAIKDARMIPMYSSAGRTTEIRRQ